MYALHNETTPRFYRCNMTQVISTLHSLSLPFDREAARKQVQHPGLDPALQDVLVDMLCAKTLFNDLPSTKKVDLYLFQEILVSYCYRLLAIPHSHDPPRIDDAYHVGLMIFLMSLFLHVGSQRFMEYDNLTRRLRRVFESEFLEGEDELKLWVLMMGSVWVASDEDTEWLLVIMRGLMRSLELGSWSEVVRVLKRWPWIGTLHDGPGRMFWSRVITQ